MSAAPRVDPNFLRFQQDIKRTAFGVRFARALFTGGNVNLSQKFLRESFKQLGLEIPASVELTLDTAQMIASGSAMIDAVDAYETFDDIRAVTRTGGNALAASMQVFEALGWIEKDTDEMQMIRTAVNVCAIVSSFGLDVKAWIALALDVTGFEAKNQMNAKMIAMQGLASGVQARFAPQSLAAAQNLKAFQEKKISAFAFVGRMAEVAPDLWPQYFPQFQSWAPLNTASMVVTGESRTWYGSSSSHHAEHVWKTISGWSPDQIKSFVFRYLAEPTLFPFYIANEFYESQNKASMKTLAALGALGLLDKIKPSDNSDALYRNSVTLADFYDPIVLKYLAELKPPTANVKTSAFVVGGVEALSQTEALERKKKFFTYENRKLLEIAEMNGRIDIVATSPELRQLISKAMTFEPIKVQEKYGIWNEARVAEYGRGGATTSTTTLAGVSSPGQAWRNPREYFAALAMISELRKDEYFKNWDLGALEGQTLRTVTNHSFGASYSQAYSFSRDIDSYDFLPEVDEMDSMIREINLKITMRRVNELALGNVAYYLGTEPKKLLRLNRGKDESAVYDKRG